MRSKQDRLLSPQLVSGYQQMPGREGYHGVVGLLAILKTGNPYLPLDPATRRTDKADQWHNVAVQRSTMRSSMQATTIAKWWPQIHAPRAIASHRLLFRIYFFSDRLPYTQNTHLAL